MRRITMAYKNSRADFKRKGDTMAKEKGMIGKVVLIRADRAGVMVGTLKSRKGSDVVLTNSRRIWYWDGAASISQIAQSGVSKPQNCKFTESVSEILVLGVIEIIPMTKEAIKSVNEVVPWKA